MAAASKTKNEEIVQSEEEENGNIGECPVCSETRTNTRYYSCLKGHSICGVCKVENSKCSICKGGFSDPPARNIAVEEFIKCNPNLACKYKHYGCPFIGTAAQLESHDRSESCLFIPAPCPAPSCLQMVAIPNMNQHINKEHGDHLIILKLGDYIEHNYKVHITESKKDINKIESKNSQGWTYTDEDKRYFGKVNIPAGDSLDFKLIQIEYDKQDFYLVIEHDRAKKRASIWCFVRGNKNMAERFNFFLKIITRKGSGDNIPTRWRKNVFLRRSMNFPSNVHHIWTRRSDALKSVDCLSLDSKLMEQYGDLSKENGLSIDVSFIVELGGGKI